MDLKKLVSITTSSSKLSTSASTPSISSSKVKLQSYEKYNSSSKTYSSSPIVREKIPDSLTQLPLNRQKILNFKWKEEMIKKSKNKNLSIIRLQLNYSIHQKKIGISTLHISFFQLTKLLKVINHSSKKTFRSKKSSSFLLLSFKSITNSNIKKPTNIINPSDIIERVWIASSKKIKVIKVTIFYLITIFQVINFLQKDN